MPEVIEIRELGGEEPDRASVPTGGEGASSSEQAAADGGPRWRRRAASGVVLVLFVTVAYMLSVGRPHSAVSPGSGSRAPVDATPAEDAAGAALDAWARFASTGDVNQLADRFDRAGPQFARLKDEAPAVAARSGGGVGTAPYAFSTSFVGVRGGSSGDEELVSADVVLSRPGEGDQSFAWELVMRRSGSRWRLWTVRDRATTAGGGS